MAKFLSSLKGFMTSAIIAVAALSFVAGGTMLTPVAVHAQDPCNTSGAGGRLPNFGSNCIKGLSNVNGTRQGVANLVQTVVNFFIFILAAVCVGFIVFGGYLFVTDGGDGTSAAKGKKIIINAIIGLVVALVSYTIVSLVVGFTTSLDLSGATSSGTNGGLQN